MAVTSHDNAPEFAPAQAEEGRALLDRDDDEDEYSEEEAVAEYHAFLRDLDEDEALGSAWRHINEARGWR